MSQPSLSSDAPTRDDQPRPLLQQAPVVPLDASGLTASLVGTAMFGVATLICYLVAGDTKWTEILGLTTLVGGILIAYTAWHRAWVRRRAGGASTADPVNDPVGSAVEQWLDN